MPQLFPVILSGGVGARLWPLSRRDLPKQFLPLVGRRTLLQETARRVSREDLFRPLLAIGAVEHRFLLAEQLRAVGARSAPLVLEPEGRGTAAAAAVAALLALEADPDAVLLILPSDHRIEDEAAFFRALEDASAAVRQGRLVLFGIRPSGPETGYGYIRPEQGSGTVPPLWTIASFAEKPDFATAQAYVASGDYLWNSGIFLLPGSVLLAELERHEPTILSACREAVAHASRDADFIRLAPEIFARIPFLSLDRAVMERTRQSVVLAVDFGWSDVGTWSSLWELGEKDGDENVILGEAVAVEAQGCYIRSESQVVAVSDVRDLVVVATRDAVLVTSRRSAQDVGRIVDRLGPKDR